LEAKCPLNRSLPGQERLPPEMRNRLMTSEDRPNTGATWWPCWPEGHWIWRLNGQGPA